MEFWKRNRIQNPTVMDLLAFMKFAALAEVRHLPSFPPSPSPFPTDRDNRKTKQGAITCICGRHARASLSSYAGGIFSRSRRVPFKIGGLLCRPSSLVPPFSNVEAQMPSNSSWKAFKISSFSRVINHFLGGQEWRNHCWHLGSREAFSWGNKHEVGVFDFSNFQSMVRSWVGTNGSCILNESIEIRSRRRISLLN